MESVWVVTDNMWHEYTKVIGVCATKELADKLIQIEISGKEGYYRRDFEHHKSFQYVSSENQRSYDAEEKEIII